MDIYEEHFSHEPHDHSFVGDELRTWESPLDYLSYGDTAIDGPWSIFDNCLFMDRDIHCPLFAEETVAFSYKDHQMTTNGLRPWSANRSSFGNYQTLLFDNDIKFMALRNVDVDVFLLCL